MSSEAGEAASIVTGRSLVVVSILVLQLVLLRETAGVSRMFTCNRGVTRAYLECPEYAIVSESWAHVIVEVKEDDR